MVLNNRSPFNCVLRKMCACHTFALNRENAIMQMSNQKNQNIKFKMSDRSLVFLCSVILFSMD